MAKNPKRRRDFNQIAAQIVRQSTGQAEPEPVTKPGKAKNPAAVAMGKIGGVKGGPARAKGDEEAKGCDWEEGLEGAVGS